LTQIIRISLMVFIISIFSAEIPADEGRGLSIAREMKAQERGYGNYTAEMKMVLVDTGGKESVRLLRVRSREMEDDGDQSLAIFDSPADIKGTAFLTHTHIKQDDDQWLYLPSLKRVKRISPANKTAPFMGSEFSYEDLASIEIERFRFSYVGEEALEGVPCSIIERYPLDPYSGYSKHRVWVEKARYIALKAEYYNRKGEKLKTLLTSDFRQYLGRFWRAHQMRMNNHISGKHSFLYWDKFRFRQDLSDADFNPNSLKRMR